MKRFQPGSARALRSGILPLALLLAVLLTVLLARMLQKQATSPCSRDSSFVTAQGSYFCYSGRVLLFYGASMYHGPWTSSERSYIDQEVAMALVGGLNTLRAVNFLDGVSNYRDQMVWSNVDYLMRRARAHHIFVILDLSTYRNNLERNGRTAYDVSDYKGFLDFVGKRYSDESALAFYSLAGEPAAPNSHDRSKVSTQALTDFYARTSAMLHAADRGHHLISSGGLLYLGAGSGIDWKSIFSLPYVAMASIHVYSTWDQDNAVPMVSRWAVRHGKPFVIEEFGFDQGKYTDLQRSIHYASIYALGLRYNAAGIAFWNLGSDGGFDTGPYTAAVWKTVGQFSRQFMDRLRTTGLPSGQSHAAPCVTDALAGPGAIPRASRTHEIGGQRASAGRRNHPGTVLGRAFRPNVGLKGRARARRDR